MYIPPVPVFDNDKIFLVPMFGVRVHPGCFKLVFLSQKGVSDGKIMICTLGQEEQNRLS